jgi:hypothetical protein
MHVTWALHLPAGCQCECDVQVLELNWSLPLYVMSFLRVSLFNSFLNYRSYLFLSSYQRCCKPRRLLDSPQLCSSPSSSPSSSLPLHSFHWSPTPHTLYLSHKVRHKHSPFPHRISIPIRNHVTGIAPGSTTPASCTKMAHIGASALAVTLPSPLHLPSQGHGHIKAHCCPTEPRSLSEMIKTFGYFTPGRST